MLIGLLGKMLVVICWARTLKILSPSMYKSSATFLDPQHSNYIYCLSWFQFYNRVLVCSHLGGLQRIINVAMQRNIDYGVVGYAAQELDAMRLVMHRNINALLHLKHNEEIPMFDAPNINYKQV